MEVAERAEVNRPQQPQFRLNLCECRYQLQVLRRSHEVLPCRPAICPCALRPGTRSSGRPFRVGAFPGGGVERRGRGLPGQSTGVATFRFELEGKVLARRSYADMAAANGRPTTHHEDLLWLYPEWGQLKGLYLDNEGHVLQYQVAAIPGGVALTSEVGPGPGFRLSYFQTSEGLVNLRFEIAPPNALGTFKTYLEAVTRKQNRAFLQTQNGPHILGAVLCEFEGIRPCRAAFPARTWRARSRCP